MRPPICDKTAPPHLENPGSATEKGSLQNKEALATVTGIEDGTGSIGGALRQILIPIIQLRYNWFFVFYLFMIMVRVEQLKTGHIVSQDSFKKALN